MTQYNLVPGWLSGHVADYFIEWNAEGRLKCVLACVCLNQRMDLWFLLLLSLFWLSAECFVFEPFPL